MASSLKHRLRYSIYGKAQKFIIPGFFAEKYIRKYLKNPLITYVNNSIEENKFKLGDKDVVKKFSMKNIIFTFSGSLIKRKGIHLLLKAFMQVLTEQPEWRNLIELRILGAGPFDIMPYEDDNIHFEGFCEAERYQNFMKTSHVFVLPSLWDCNPLTVIEALFAGNILIVSDSAGNYPEAVNGNGFVISTNSVQSIKKAICEIISYSKEKRLEMALMSLQTSKNFTIQRSVNGFLEAILAT